MIKDNTIPIWCYDGKDWSEPQTLTHQPGRWRPVNILGRESNLLTINQVDDIAEPGNSAESSAIGAPA